MYTVALILKYNLTNIGQSLLIIIASDRLENNRQGIKKSDLFKFTVCDETPTRIIRGKWLTIFCSSA